MSKPDTENELPTLSVAFPTEREVDKDNPWRDDCLGRKNIAKTLTNLAENAMAENANSAFVMSVHGEWGTGKTFMLKRLQKQLEKDKRTAIYFNAWEDDFSTDPLTAIIGQLYQSLNDIAGADDLQKQAKKLLILGLSMARKALFNRALSYAGLDKDDMSSDEQKILKNYNSSREELKQLREGLIALTIAIKKETKFPLVFIVDELDRCRPTFALEVLERVKHLFNVPGMVFIFGINKKSLEKSIEAVYGNIDASDYLRRFFHLELNLPPVDTGKFTRILLEENSVLDFVKSNDLAGAWDDAMNRGYLALVQMMGLTLREIEYSIRLISLVLKGRRQQDFYPDIEGWAVVCLVLLKVKLPELYGEFVRGECLCNKVIDKMEKTMRDGGEVNHAISARGGDVKETRIRKDKMKKEEMKKEEVRKRGVGMVEIEEERAREKMMREEDVTRMEKRRGEIREDEIRREAIGKEVNASFYLLTSGKERLQIKRELEGLAANKIKGEDCSYLSETVKDRGSEYAKKMKKRIFHVDKHDVQIPLNEFVALLDLADGFSQE